MSDLFENTENDFNLKESKLSWGDSQQLNGRPLFGVLKEKHSEVGSPIGFHFEGYLRKRPSDPQKLFPSVYALHVRPDTPKCPRSDSLYSDDSRGSADVGYPDTPDFVDSPAPITPVLANDFVRLAFSRFMSLETFRDELEHSLFVSEHSLDNDRDCVVLDHLISVLAHEKVREAQRPFVFRDFIADQRQPFNGTMIATLADWMIEVQEHFGWPNEVLHLAWSYLYACLDQGPPVSSSQGMLYGCAAFMVACKYEGITKIDIEAIAGLTDSAVTTKDIIEAERHLLGSIDFNIRRPNPSWLLTRYISVYDARVTPLIYLCSFLLDGGTHCHAINLESASKRAASVLYLARRLLGNPSWEDWRKDPAGVPLDGQGVKSDGEVERRQRQSKSIGQMPPPPPLTIDTDEDSVDGVEEARRRRLVWPPPLNCDNGEDSLDEADGILLWSRHVQAVEDARRHLRQTGLPATFHVKADDVALEEAARRCLFCPQPSDPTTTKTNVFMDDGLRAKVVGQHLVCSPLPRTSNYADEEDDRSSMEEARRPLIFPPTLTHDFENLDGNGPSLEGHRRVAEETTSLIHDKTNVMADYRSLLKDDVDLVRLEDTRRRLVWPPLLAQLTGFSEVELLPLALSHHRTVLQLLAEVARGEKLARNDHPDVHCDRCYSPGGHQLRRRLVTKYCGDQFQRIALLYPQLAFDPRSPTYKQLGDCPENCLCYVCANLLPSFQSHQPHQTAVTISVSP